MDARVVKKKEETRDEPDASSLPRAARAGVGVGVGVGVATMLAKVRNSLLCNPHHCVISNVNRQ